MNIRFGIKNFGPISKGVMDLKPLTIFIGPNNSGKSYAAVLLHSILSVENRMLPASGSPLHVGFEAQNQVYDQLISYSNKARKNTKTASLDALTELGKKINSQYISKMFGAATSAAIAANFNSEVRQLVRSGSRSASVSVNGPGGLSISISDRVEVRRKNDNPFETGMDHDIDSEINSSMKDLVKELTHKRNGGMSSSDMRFNDRRLTMLMLASLIQKNRLRGVPHSSFYFPASRSELLVAHKVISASMVRNAQFAGLERPEIPGLKGVVSDFVSEMILLNESSGEYYDLATRMEGDLLGGHIELKKGKDNVHTQIYFRTDDLEIPLHKTSSTVSEVASLSLYLKYVAVPGSLLVIEEPEAHMHPENLAVMARYIVRMIRGGLNVLVTTQSPTMVDVISLYIRSKDASAPVRRNMGFEPGDYLDVGEVAPYLFKKSGKSGCTIKKIKTDAKDGIDQEEFTTVIDDLYDISVKLVYGLKGTENAV